MSGTKTKPKNDSPVGQTIRLILERAVKTGASDVHLEPRLGFGVVRQRVNGLLQLSAKLPGASFGEVVAQLKKSAGLDERKKRTPQNGKYRLMLGRREYEVQVATLPVLDGERVALHIADDNISPVSLAELGFWGPGLQALNNALTEPHGLILISSEDGISTKLTLGSLLNTLASAHRRVATVEESVLYRLPSANQMVVRREIGLTFARRQRESE